MDERQLHISITTGTVVRAILLVAAAALLFYLRDLVLIVLTAIVLSSAIDPGVHVLMRRGLPRTLSVIFVYLLIFLAFFIVFYFFLPSLLEDLATFIQTIPSYLNSFGQSDAFSQYAQILGFETSGGLDANSIIAGVRDALNLGVFNNAFTAATTIFGGVFSFILIIVFSFYFTVVDTGVEEFIKVMAPHRHEAYVLHLWQRSKHKIGLWMQGQLLLGFIMGILVYLGLTILGVQHALVLALIVSLFELIPVFGPVFAAIPAIAIAFVGGGAGLGFATIALYIIAQQFENHLIYPLVVTRVVGVPPLLVILALIVGGELAGFLGIILSVPAAAVIQELVKDMESGRLRRHEEQAARMT